MAIPSLTLKAPLLQRAEPANLFRQKRRHPRRPQAKPLRAPRQLCPSKRPHVQPPELLPPVQFINNSKLLCVQRALHHRLKLRQLLSLRFWLHLQPSLNWGMQTPERWGQRTSLRRQMAQRRQLHPQPGRPPLRPKFPQLSPHRQRLLPVLLQPPNFRVSVLVPTPRPVLGLRKRLPALPPPRLENLALCVWPNLQWNWLGSPRVQHFRLMSEFHRQNPHLANLQALPRRLAVVVLPRQFLPYPRRPRQLLAWPLLQLLSRPRGQQRQCQVVAAPLRQLLRPPSKLPSRLRIVVPARLPLSTRAQRHPGMPRVPVRQGMRQFPRPQLQLQQVKRLPLQRPPLRLRRQLGLIRHLLRLRAPQLLWAQWIGNRRALRKWSRMYSAISLPCPQPPVPPLPAISTRAMPTRLLPLL